jgi:hypothetical protein
LREGLLHLHLAERQRASAQVRLQALGQQVGDVSDPPVDLVLHQHVEAGRAGGREEDQQ